MAHILTMSVKKGKFNKKLVEFLLIFRYSLDTSLLMFRYSLGTSLNCSQFPDDSSPGGNSSFAEQVLWHDIPTELFSFP